MDAQMAKLLLVDRLNIREIVGLYRNNVLSNV
jgi:hypothetical protein